MPFPTILLAIKLMPFIVLSSVGWMVYGFVYLGFIGFFKPKESMNQRPDAVAVNSLSVGNQTLTNEEREQLRQSAQIQTHTNQDIYDLEEGFDLEPDGDYKEDFDGIEVSETQNIGQVTAESATTHAIEPLEPITQTEENILPDFVFSQQNPPFKFPETEPNPIGMENEDVRRLYDELMISYYESEESKLNIIKQIEILTAQINEIEVSEGRNYDEILMECNPEQIALLNIQRVKIKMAG